MMNEDRGMVNKIWLTRIILIILFCIILSIIMQKTYGAFGTFLILFLVSLFMSILTFFILLKIFGRENYAEIKTTIIILIVFSSSFTFVGAIYNGLHTYAVPYYVLSYDLTIDELVEGIEDGFNISLYEIEDSNYIGEIGRYPIRIGYYFTSPGKYININDIGLESISVIQHTPRWDKVIIELREIVDRIIDIIQQEYNKEPYEIYFNKYQGAEELGVPM